MRTRILLLAALVSTPAFADHAGPTGVGAGGGLNVLGFDTLDEGQFAAGLRVTYIRPDQRPDSVLEDLAGQHIHAHNTDYNLNASAETSVLLATTPVHHALGVKTDD